MESEDEVEVEVEDSDVEDEVEEEEVKKIAPKPQVTKKVEEDEEGEE